VTLYAALTMISVVIFCTWIIVVSLIAIYRMDKRD